MQPIRVLIADDHPVVRSGLRIAIAQDPLLEVVAEACDGGAAIEEIARLNPHVAVFDINMPKMDGIAAARKVRERDSQIKLIFLTVHDGEDLFHTAFQAGANGYLLKDSALMEIVAAIRAVCEGGYYVTGCMMGYLLNHRTRETNAGNAVTREAASLPQLSPVERRIVRLIAANRSTRDIAAELGLSVRTIENRRTAICEKLNLHGANALLKFALEHKADLA